MKLDAKLNPRDYASRYFFCFPKSTGVFFGSMFLMGVLGYWNFGTASILLGAIASVLMAVSLKFFVLSGLQGHIFEDRPRYGLNLVMIIVPEILAIVTVSPVLIEVTKQ